MTHYNGHLPLAKQALADSIYACELPIKQQPAYRHYSSNGKASEIEWSSVSKGSPPTQTKRYSYIDEAF